MASSSTFGTYGSPPENLWDSVAVADALLLQAVKDIQVRDNVFFGTLNNVQFLDGAYEPDLPQHEQTRLRDIYADRHECECIQRMSEAWRALQRGH
jgi:hypothetical protein